MKLIINLPADVETGIDKDGQSFLAVPVASAAAFVEQLGNDVDELGRFVDEMAGPDGSAPKGRRRSS